MSYPSVVTSFSTKVNGAVIDASDVNNVQTDVVAIETFVGTEASTVGTLFYDIRAAGSGGGGHIQTANKGGTGQTAYTKGDILVASSSSVLAKLAVGSDNQVLTADSTQAAGAKWAGAAAAEWTPVSVMTFIASSVQQAFSSLTSHTYYKLIHNIKNVSSTTATLHFRVNSVASGSYSYTYRTNAAISGADNQVQALIWQGAATTSSAYQGETVLNGNTPAVLSSIYSYSNIGASSNGPDNVAFGGNMQNISSFISQIAIIPTVPISGTVELRYKDIA